MNKPTSADAKLKKRYDNCNHWVEFDGKPSRSRCKLSGCDGFTHVICRKCDVHLCCKPNRNCFQNFHTKNQMGIEKQKKSTKSMNQLKKMTPKNSGSQAKIAKRNMRRAQYIDTPSGIERATTASQNIPSPILKNVKSTMSSTRKNGAKKVQWKPILCQEFVFSNASSIQEVNIVNSVSPQHQSRRKTKHQVKANSDELEFIEINN